MPIIHAYLQAIQWVPVLKVPLISVLNVSFFYFSVNTIYKIPFLVFLYFKNKIKQQKCVNKNKNIKIIIYEYFYIFVNFVGF